MATDPAALRVTLQIDGGFAYLPGLAGPIALNAAQLGDEHAAQLQRLCESACAVAPKRKASRAAARPGRPALSADGRIGGFAARGHGGRPGRCPRHRRADRVRREARAALTRQVECLRPAWRFPSIIQLFLCRDLNAQLRFQKAHPRHRRRRLPRLAPVRPPARAGPRGALRRQPLHRHQAQHRPPARPTRASSSCATTSRSRCTSRWTRSTTSPARPRRSTTSTTRCRRPRPRCTARSTCWGSPSACAARIFQASTSEVYGDPHVHPQPETTGATSTRSASAPATTRASAAPRRCSSTTTASTSSRSRSRASSTPTARGCIPADGRVVSNFIVQALKNEPITDLRRRPADALVLLRGRPDRRPSWR